nr:hypothetical protein BaRGS_010854 [Batillaria attramentaria]
MDIMDIEETSCHHAPAKNDDVQTTVSPQTSVSDQLHTAVTLGQHSLIPQLTNRGLTPDQLNRAAATAISTSKWACVVELIKLGVDSELRDFALMKAVEQNESSYVATLARLSLGPDMVHVAKRMREAVHHGHWECVKELVSLGVSTEQKRILLTEGFTQNQWRVIPELVTVFTDPELTDLVLKEALAHNQWECVTSLINIGIDKDQMCYVCEQAAARDQWHQAFDALKKGLWDVILRHYEDDVVSKSSRQFALQRAMKQGAWVYVTKMAEKTVTDQRDRREAFAEAVRQSEWRSAMKLCDQPDLTVRNGDVTRTLKTCLSLDVFDVYLEFCKRFLAAGKRSAIDSVTYAAFKAAVQARNWDFARDATKFGEISLSLRQFVGILPLVRLLHESGSSSNRELYLLKKDSSIRTQLESQRRQDIVHYVDHAATNPPSLQHLKNMILYACVFVLVSGDN